MPPAQRRRVLEVESPDWWITRLWIQMQRRQQAIEFYSNYYVGQHPLPWLSPRAADEFREILRMSRSNYMGLVIDAQVERMNVEGFRLGVKTAKVSRSDASKNSKDSKDAEDADFETWRIWTENSLDAEFDKGLLEAAIAGTSYLLVAPNEKDAKTPHIWVEHPSQAIVEHVPGTSRREVAAGLRVYDDDWTGKLNAVLYLPDGLYKYELDRPRTAMPKVPLSDLEGKMRMGAPLQMEWNVREVNGESWPAPNRTGTVTLFEIPNNPRLMSGGRSEIEDVTDIQDRVNKTLADRIITQDYGAFPQKWVSGWPNEDLNGNAQPEIETGRNRIVSTEVVETKFGQWDAAPLDPYSAAKREDIKDIASRTRTPAQYLLGEMSNVNGQTLKASESGLVAKVRQRMRNVDSALERAMMAAREMAGLPTSGVTVQTIWRNPEFRTEGELVDALTKMATLGVPQEVLWERWGASPTEIQRWKDMQDEAAQKAAEMDPMGALAQRYRELAGQGAIPMQAPGQPAQGGAGGAGGIDYGPGGRSGAPGVKGQPGKPGKDGAAGSPGSGRVPGTPGAKAGA